MGIKIFTDAGSNLFSSIIKDKGLDITLLPMSLRIGDKEYLCYEDNIDASEFSKNFYLEMEAGAVPHTSLPNPGLFLEKATIEAKRGNKVICITLSSGISGTYQSNFLIAQQINEEMKEEVVKVIDSKTAGFGEGMIAIYADHLVKEGLSFEEVIAKIESYVPIVRSEFTVNSIKYLAITGRISNFKATIADVLNIKPLLYGSPEGKIVPFANARGRKNALKKLSENVAMNIANKNETVYITHCNALEDTKFFANLLHEKGISHTETYYFDLVTGAHVGPGTIAVFYEGNNRDISRKSLIQTILGKK